MLNLIYDYSKVYFYKLWFAPLEKFLQMNKHIYKSYKEILCYSDTDALSMCNNYYQFVEN